MAVASQGAKNGETEPKGRELRAYIVLQKEQEYRLISCIYTHTEAAAVSGGIKPVHNAIDKRVVVLCLALFLGFRRDAVLVFDEGRSADVSRQSSNDAACAEGRILKSSSLRVSSTCSWPSSRTQAGCFRASSF